MNISRIALLSIFLTAPMFAMDTTSNNSAVAAAEGFLTKTINFVGAPFFFVGNTTLNAADWLAKKSYLNALISQITNINCLKNTCINNPDLIGQTIVLSAAAYAAYQAYLAYNEQAIDNDEDIFGDDEYASDSN